MNEENKIIHVIGQMKEKGFCSNYFESLGEMDNSLKLSTQKLKWKTENELSFSQSLLKH